MGKELLLPFTEEETEAQSTPGDPATQMGLSGLVLVLSLQRQLVQGGHWAVPPSPAVLLGPHLRKGSPGILLGNMREDSPQVFSTHGHFNTWQKTLWLFALLI